MNEKDYLIRAIAANDEVRAFAVTSRNLVEHARTIHDYSPIATAALGRLLSASLMMGDMLKSDDDLLTLIIKGDGPLKQVLVTSDKSGNTKGYVSNPFVDIEPNASGHLNVGAGIGNGTLTVIRDYHMKEPYNSTINLVTGEIAEDLTYYFAQSEQTNTAVGLGVLFNKDNVTVKEAGGFIIQLMPFTSESTIQQLEQNMREFTTVTDCLSEGDSPEDILKRILKGFDIRFTERKDVRFNCRCSHEKGLQILNTLSVSDLDEMIAENNGAEISCDFCGQKYYYTTDELKELRSKKNQ